MGLVLTWPVGHDRSKPRSAIPQGPPIVAYVLGSAVGGSATGLAVGALGTLLVSAAGAAIVAVAVVALAIASIVLEWRGRVAPLPERKKQVPRGWLQWRYRSATAAVFGLIIGAGAFTYLKHATAYVLAGLCLFAPSLGAAVAVGALYGLTRSLTAVAMWRADRSAATRPWLPTGGSSPALHRGLAAVAVVVVVATAVLTIA